MDVTYMAFWPQQKLQNNNVSFTAYNIFYIKEKHKQANTTLMFHSPPEK